MKALAKSKSQKTKGIVRQKILLFVCILLLIIPAVIIWLSYTSHQPNHPRSLIETKNIVTNEVTPINMLPSYHGDSYSFTYPDGWRENEEALGNRPGMEIELQPIMASEEMNTHVTIEIVDANLTSIGTLTSPFRFFQYSETNTVVAGIAAQKYATIIPSNEGTLHEIDYIFEKNKKIYLLKLDYMQTTVNPQVENQFSQIVNSFSLK